MASFLLIRFELGSKLRLLVLHKGILTFCNIVAIVYLYIREIQDKLGRFWYSRIGGMRYTLCCAATNFEQFAPFWH